MNRNHIRENFSNGYQWAELLKGNLEELGLQYESIILVSAIEMYKRYVGFMRVRHIPFSENERGAWFSKFVKVVVIFNHEMDVYMGPVHNRNEIADWRDGTLLVDNRKTELAI